MSTNFVVPSIIWKIAPPPPGASRGGGHLHKKVKLTCFYMFFFPRGRGPDPPPPPWIRHDEWRYVSEKGHSSSDRGLTSEATIASCCVIIPARLGKIVSVYWTPFCRQSGIVRGSHVLRPPSKQRIQLLELFDDGEYAIMNNKYFILKLKRIGTPSYALIILPFLK